MGVRARVRFRVMIGARVSDSAYQTLLIVQNSPVLPDKETLPLFTEATTKGKRKRQLQESIRCL